MNKCKKVNGFTLIEIMVATIIMVILAGLLIQITSQVLDFWSRSTGKLSSGSEATMAIEIIANDLESSVFRNDGQEWFRAENVYLDKPFNSGTVALRFFTVIKNKMLNSDGSVIPGDISAVAYNLEYANPIDGTSEGQKNFVLYRLQVDPLSTYNNLLGLESRLSLPDKDSTSWGKDNPIKGVNGENYLASNIIDFSIKFYVEDDGNRNTTTEYFEKSPNNPRYSLIYGGKNATVGPQAKVAHYKKPLSHADIKLTILSDEGVEMMRNIEKNAKTPEEVILQHGEVYIRRVSFKTKPF